MKKKTNSNKKDLDKKNRRKKEKLNELIGVDLCSCFPMFFGKCVGTCRSIHTRGKNVECFCLYRVEDTEEYVALNKKGRKPKPKEVDELSDKERRKKRFKFKNENREDV